MTDRLLYQKAAWHAAFVKFSMHSPGAHSPLSPRGAGFLMPTCLTLQW